MNVILVIESGNPHLGSQEDGSSENPRCWIMVTQENCSQFVFGNFINSMLSNMEDRLVSGEHDNK